MNLELIIDAASDAAVGISVRDEEDSPAVIEAFEHGKRTTGDSRLAQLLDNRLSNHTPEVDAALDATMRIRATPARPSRIFPHDRARLERALLRRLWPLE